MGANNGKQYGSEGKGSSSISSDVSSSTDHTPTKAQKNAATSEGVKRASPLLKRGEHEASFAPFLHLTKTASHQWNLD